MGSKLLKTFSAWSFGLFSLNLHEMRDKFLLHSCHRDEKKIFFKSTYTIILKKKIVYKFILFYFSSRDEKYDIYMTRIL